MAHKQTILLRHQILIFVPTSLCKNHFFNQKDCMILIKRMFVILFVTYYGLLQSKIFFLERTFPALSKEIYIAFHAAVNTG